MVDIDLLKVDAIVLTENYIYFSTIAWIKHSLIQGVFRPNHGIDYSNKKSGSNGESTKLQSVVAKY